MYKNQPALLTFTFPALLLASGCAVTQLTSAGSAVAVGSGTPPGCEFLGTVSGEEGGNAQSAETNMVAVQAQLRNKAAALGATLVVPTSQQNGEPGAIIVVGKWSGACANCITMVGSAYRCSDSAPSGSMAAGEPRVEAPKVPTADPPLGAAGFTFGSNLEEAAKQCTDAASTWEPLGEDHYRCSGTPVDTGFAATSRLKLCDGKLCSVILIVPSEGGVPGWMKQYRSIQAALVKKYGIASTSENVFPEDCFGGSVTCFEEGRASVRSTWSWPTKQSISLVLGRIDAAVSIGIVYSAGKEGKKGTPNPSAL